MLPPVRSSRTFADASATDSGTPSTEPLSARITCGVALVAAASVVTKCSRCSPGE
ncbi:Uncharacterised protein [Mycobacteroides abscessus subsp. abscessus]|nr:Uncharacterised protein [Mycobacteroides abscessus subsp. abscessus]